jgi:hypothetical protein
MKKHNREECGHLYLTTLMLPVITVSSRALFMRAIAFSLVGAHTISCNMVPKLPN